MFRPLTASHRRPHRRGTSFILIVVVMLSLFSAVGTAYALFAMREARLALSRKDEAGGGTAAPLKAPDPTDTINRFFSVLIYDAGNDSFSDLTNGVRGHSLSRSMYGGDAMNPYNTTPWNGIGILHEKNAYGDRAFQVNHTIMNVGTTAAPVYMLLDPEYTGQRAFNAAGAPVLPFNPSDPTNPRAYFAKNAGYSFADLKDFFLAAVDPATGEVLVPSFHRPALFGPQGLAPSNPIWKVAQGQLLTLRPTQYLHPKFPVVPPDFDGQYRGDVQNLVGGVGTQKNDSIWLNLGLPVITLPGNRKVQPLVAALVVPLNGSFNASVHGNNYNQTGTGHASFNGFGPHEVNMGAAIGTDASGVVIARGQQNVPRWWSNLPSTPPPSPPMRQFSPYPSPNGPGPLPNHSPVAWDNSTVPMPITYPQATAPQNMVGVPTFQGLQYLNNPALATFHPTFFNPSEWPSSTQLSNRIFALSDTKRFLLRYANTPSWYGQSDLASAAPTGLKGQYPFTIATAQTTQNAYRLDPAHANRLLFTPISYDLDRPKIAPNFASRDASNALSFNNPPAVGIPPRLGSVIPPGAYPSPQSPGSISDFPQPTVPGIPQWKNVMAALGSVNLNRPLADYRANTNQALSQANIGNAAQADADRQQLAKDIFIRLAVALGAAAYVDTDPTGAPRITLPDATTKLLTLPKGGTVGPFTQQQYDALRYLAQLAVNIVDYIDNDDICTVFVWNPDPSSGSANFGSASDVANRVVVGHEKTRLVINEMYSEVVNDNGDPINGVMGAPPTGPAQVRFWAELLNPSTQMAPGTGALGDGSVPLSAYRIEIRRANRVTVEGMTAADTNATAQSDYLFNNAANPTGGFDTSTSGPDATFSLQNQNVTVPPNVSIAGGANPVYTPQYAAAAGGPAQGVVLVGPPAAPKANSDQFTPDTTAGVWQGMIQSGAPGKATNSNSMGYTIPLPGAGVITTPEFKRHIVLLRRLANPYQNPAAASPSNMYVTVDLMDYVPSFDAVNRLQGGGLNRNPQGMMNANPNGYDPTSGRFSVGKVQPYAGHAFVQNVSGMSGSAGYNTYTFPQSMVLNQNPGTPVAGEPKHTFGRHNGAAGTQPGGQTFQAGATPSLLDPAGGGGAETLMTPFDWLVHLDRPLVNQTEVFDVRDSAPHLVTDRFIWASANPTATGKTPGITYDYGMARWTAADGIWRGLEYLSVKPYVFGVAHGGRVPGRINVNAIQDKRILQGLLDAPQVGTATGNAFDTNFVNNFAWQQWMQTRNGVQQRPLADGSTMLDTAAAPGQSIYDINTLGGNKPFFSFGAPAANPDNTGTALAWGSGGNVDQTILRRFTPAPNSPPALFVNSQSKKATVTYPSQIPEGPVYMQAEAVRKMMNNTTTVNNQYVVYVTIGYFDVVGTVQITPSVSIPQLGAEAFLSVPGDMRQKFVGVVDMTSMGLKPIFPDPADPTNTNPHATEAPFFTSLEATATGTPGNPSAQLTIPYARFVSNPAPTPSQLYVTAEGQEVQIVPGSTFLVVGYGVEQQVVLVTSVSQGPVLGQAVVSVTTVPPGGVGAPPPFRTAYGGTCVSNVRPGYPGPQPDFSYSDPKYKGVLPYIERLR